jgi:3-phenylpropionate/trans-cinnamate dioxygenase ferredoxin subunit
MERLHHICHLDRFPQKGIGRFDIDGKELVVARYDNNYFAASNICAHQHISRLHEGSLNGCVLECPMHGWQFDLRTGLSPTGQGKIMVYRVKVIDDILCCVLPEEL